MQEVGAERKTIEHNGFNSVGNHYSLERHRVSNTLCAPHMGIKRYPPTAEEFSKMGQHRDRSVEVHAQVLVELNGGDQCMLIGGGVPPMAIAAVLEGHS